MILSSLSFSGQAAIAAIDPDDQTPQVQYYNHPHERWVVPDNILIGITLLPEEKDTLRVYKKVIKAWNKTGVVHLR